MPNPNLDPDQDPARRIPERNRDPGADLDREGLPEVADDATPQPGEVPEPQQQPVPTDAPVASTAHGTTEREQLEGEPLETRLAHEEPDEPAGGEQADPNVPAERAAMHIEDDT